MYSGRTLGPASGPLPQESIESYGNGMGPAAVHISGGIPGELLLMEDILHHLIGIVYMDVSKNTGIPKWMVKIMENPIKMDDFGEKKHYFRKHPYISHSFHGFLTCQVVVWDLFHQQSQQNGVSKS